MIPLIWRVSSTTRERKRAYRGLDVSAGKPLLPHDSSPTPARRRPAFPGHQGPVFYFPPAAQSRNAIGLRRYSSHNVFLATQFSFIGGRAEQAEACTDIKKGKPVEHRQQQTRHCVRIKVTIHSKKEYQYFCLQSGGPLCPSTCRQQKCAAARGPSSAFRGGGGGLALIFIPAGGGTPPPLTPSPPSPGPPPPLPPQLKCTRKPGFWEHVLAMGKKFSAPSVHAIHCVHIAPCVLHLPCYPDYHAPTLVVSVFQLPGPTVATRKT